MSEMKIEHQKRLHAIQKDLLITKDQKGNGVTYKYRTVEGILAAVKGFLQEGETINMTDSIFDAGGMVFIEATASFICEGVTTEATGVANVEQRKFSTGKYGMTAAQWSGACSTYARKTALCGLFAIDDGSDLDDGTQNSKAASLVITEKEVAMIEQGLVTYKLSAKRQTILDHYKIKALSEIPTGEAGTVFGWLEHWKTEASK